MPFQHLKEPIKSALESGIYMEAFERAKRLKDEGDLAGALESTLAAADGDEVHFDALATRWLLMAVEDKQASLYLLYWAATRLLEHGQLDYRDSAASLREWVTDLEWSGNRDVILQDVDRALHERDLELAWKRAGRLPYLPLDRALRLVLLMADRFDSRYEAAARRFIARVVLEVRPEVIQVKKLADCLAHVQDGYYGLFAKRSLQDVIGQLQRMEPISVRFVRSDEP